jgi:hypothetical protein
LPPHLSSVTSLKKKYQKAVKEVKESLLAFEELDSSLDHPTRLAWTQQEDLAMLHRGEFLLIYQAQLNKRELKIHFSCIHIIESHVLCCSIPSPTK